MSQEWSTFGKFEALRAAGLTASQFVNICAAYGIEMSNATISRAIKARKFANHETSEMLRPLVMGLEELAERAHPIRVNFDNVENVRFLLTILAMGVELTVATIRRETK